MLTVSKLMMDIYTYRLPSVRHAWNVCIHFIRTFISSKFIGQNRMNRMCFQYAINQYDLSGDSLIKTHFLSLNTEFYLQHKIYKLNSMKNFRNWNAKWLLLSHSHESKQRKRKKKHIFVSHSLQHLFDADVIGCGQTAGAAAFKKFTQLTFEIHLRCWYRSNRICICARCSWTA